MHHRFKKSIFQDTLKKNKILVHNVLGVIGLKGLALLLSFIMTPMYLDYFSDQKILGVWYTLQSILMWVLTFDLGLGNGIRNRLASALSANHTEEAKKIVSSGYIILGIVTAIISGVLLIIVPMANWQRLLNTDLSLKVLDRVLVITMLGIVMQFFVSVISAILMALRKNIVSNSLPVFTNVVILVFLLCPHSGSDEHRFLMLTLFYVLATLTPLIVASIVVFSTELKEIRPSFCYWDLQVGKSVLSIGGGFFAVQIGLLIINSTNQVIINYLYSGDAVVQYTLYFRLFSMAPMIFTLFTQPVWSEVSVKYAQGQIDWIRKIYFVMLGVAVFIICGCLCVTGILPFIFRVWLGTNSGVIPSRSIGLIFTVWNTVELFIYASTCVANGMTHLKCQTIFTIIAAVLKIPVTFLFAYIFKNWTSIIWAHTVVLLPLMVAQNISLNRYFKRNIEKINC